MMKAQTGIFSDENKKPPVKKKIEKRRRKAITCSLIMITYIVMAETEMKTWRERRKEKNKRGKDKK